MTSEKPIGIIKATACFFAVVLFISCAAPRISSEAIAFDSQNAMGLIIGTVSFPNEKARFNGYYPMIHSLASNQKNAYKNSTEIGFRPAQITRLKHKGELNDGKTYMFAIERTPGRYEISRIRYVTMGYGTSSDSYSSGFSIPFDVRKGQITYIGEIFLDEYASQNDTLIRLYDNYDADMQSFRENHKMASWGLAKRSEMRIIYN